jgi:hypothetical protein
MAAMALERAVVMGDPSEERGDERQGGTGSGSGDAETQ